MRQASLHKYLWKDLEIYFHKVYFHVWNWKSKKAGFFYLDFPFQSNQKWNIIYFVYGIQWENSLVTNVNAAYVLDDLQS